MTVLCEMENRIQSKISVSWETGCWNWTASRGNTGYGKFELNGKTIAAHRASYEIFCEPIPSGMYVCHTCDNRACINPRHLFLGTQADNMRDKVRKGRHVTRRGNATGTAKLTEADVIEIRSLMAVPNPEIARRFGVDVSSICLIKNGKRWAHLLPAGDA